MKENTGQMNSRDVPIPHSEPFSGDMTFSFYQRRGKRWLDLALVIPLFVAALPIMLVVGISILLLSGWPVLYSSVRVGQGRREFRMWKFRTMVNNADREIQQWKESHPELAAEYAKNFKLAKDPRVTRIGKTLRKTSLDELPQLWNVLRGDMSLVGPRPYFARELEPYPEEEKTILSVPSGLTGPWQVQGRNNLPPLARMQLDVEYTSNVKPSKDFSYILRTIKALVNGK